jgi:hypothetical protein
MVWTAREWEAPHWWVIDGRMEGGGSGTITYALTLRIEGTTFEHDFVYAMPNPLPVMLDRLVFCRRIEPESAEALRRLKNVLERRVA